MSTDEIDKILARQSLELFDAMRRNEAGAAAALAKWLKQSRRHVEHYLMAAAFERELDEVKLNPDPHFAAPSTLANVLELSTPARKHRLPPSTLRYTGWMRAALAAGVAIVGILYWQAQRNEYTTTVGEQRAVELEDGSLIHLNTQSRIVVHFSEQARDIELLAGEALFKVRQEKSRPFRVHASGAVIQAIGTEFNVHRAPKGTLVAVLEGRVKVTREAGTAGLAEANLDPGQQIRIDRTGRIVTRERKQIPNVAAWRQRRLIFAATPLPEIVEEFNRYNRAPRLVLNGANAAKRVFSGVFDADDPESLAQLLSREGDIIVERRANEIVIQSYRP